MVKEGREELEPTIVQSGVLAKSLSQPLERKEINELNTIYILMDTDH